MSNLRPLSNNVLFVWVDEIKGNEDYQHASGLIIERKLDRTRDRWGKVIAVGADELDIEVGDYILPEKTHEPFGANHIVKEFADQNIEVWMTKAKDILLVSQDETVTHTMNGMEPLFDLKAIEGRTQ